MALKPARSAQFKRDVRLAKRRGWDIPHLNAVMVKLINQEKLSDEYEAHPLKGEWKGHMECHIEGNFLLIWTESETEIRFDRVGTHADLFRK